MYIQNLKGFLRTILKRVVFRLVNFILYPIIRKAVEESSRSILNQFQQQMLISNPTPESPLNLFVLQNYLYNRRGHFDKSYYELRMKRITKILEIFGTDYFKGKKLLEVGGGFGDIGAFFACLGASVVSAEYRTTNRNMASVMHRNISGFKSVFCDVENDFTYFRKYAGSSVNSKFDLILCLGILEVISDINNIILCIMKLSDNVILDTQVCDSTDPNTMLYDNMLGGYNDHPIHGMQGARPSPAYIEKLFTKNGWAFDRHFTCDLNTGSFLFDWEHKNNEEIARSIQNNEEIARSIQGTKKHLRRFWYFKNEQKINDKQN